MTRPLIEDQVQLDFAPSPARAGFRLQRLEVYNWGTFHGRVWGLDLNGDNCLVTGDIGSGKSTLIDAVATLLVPRVSYNKAAGAEARERSLRSYVLGHHKSERGEAGFSARPVALRDHNAYAVIVGRFHNEGFDQPVTLAQVFWFKEPQGQPTRVYVVADFVDAFDRRPTLGDSYRVEARIVTWEGANVRQAPAGALFQRDGGWQAFVVEGGRARLRPVKVGHTNGFKTEITGGLDEGDRVIVYPGDKVMDGIRVEPIAVTGG